MWSMNDGTYILRGSAGNTTFYVHGDAVRIVGVASEGRHESVSRATARAIWADLVRGGAKRIECEDEDGHDGEGCTCIDWQAEADRIEELDRKNFEGRFEPPVGSWASVARMMVQGGFMSGDEADRWKDEMKEGGF